MLLIYILIVRSQKPNKLVVVLSIYNTIVYYKLFPIPIQDPLDVHKEYSSNKLALILPSLNIFKPYAECSSTLKIFNSRFELVKENIIGIFCFKVQCMYQENKKLCLRKHIIEFDCLHKIVLDISLCRQILNIFLAIMIKPISPLTLQ